MDDAGFAILDSQSSILVSRRGRIVRQLHYIIEISSRVIPPHVQDIHLAGVSAGDRLESFYPGKLALVRTVVGKAASIDDLYRAVSTHYVFREPDFAVSTLTDAPEQFVI